MPQFLCSKCFRQPVLDPNVDFDIDVYVVTMTMLLLSIDDVVAVVDVAEFGDGWQ